MVLNGLSFHARRLSVYLIDCLCCGLTDIDNGGASNLKIDRKLHWLHLMARARVSLSLDCVKFLLICNNILRISLSLIVYSQQVIFAVDESHENENHHIHQRAAVGEYK